MEAKKSPRREVFPALGLLLILLAVSLGAATRKVRVIVDNASIKASPEIGGQTLANIPLNTILDAEVKQGEWYKVLTTKEGVQVSGYMHEMLVEEVGEGEAEEPVAPAGVLKSQAEITAEIDLKLAENKNLVRQEKDFDKVVNDLRPLLAKAFSVEDHARQRQIACEIYLWLGLAYAKKGDDYGALVEFKNMFDVDYAYAKVATRNIYDPIVSGFIEHAEKQYRGLLVEYSLEISTEPKEATLKIDGKEIGLSPEVYRTTLPKFTLEIEKEGFKPIREDMFLSQAMTKKEYTLESSGRTLIISTTPDGANVFLDGQDTGKVTNCELPYVPYGGHTIRLEKKNYAEWEEPVQILEGGGSIPLDIILTAKNYVQAQRWGGLESNFLKLPKGIALDKDGSFYVVDDSEIKVKKFDADGQFQGTWGEAGREFRVLKEPTGITVDGQGFIYITDTKGACVVKFGNNGKFVSKWGKGGAKEGEFMTPIGIAVDHNNDVYVADSGNNRIVKYSTGGVVKQVWGKQGAGQGEFVFPTGIAVNQKNEIVVVDRVHIQKFSPDGEFIEMWGKPGSGAGELNRPLGLGLDQHGFIYVADSGNSRVQKFSGAGKFITQWGTQGTIGGPMATPFGIAVSPAGSVLVVERDNNSIQEFKVSSQ